jgi:hypothetical protein
LGTLWVPIYNARRSKMGTFGAHILYDLAAFHVSSPATAVAGEERQTVGSYKWAPSVPIYNLHGSKTMCSNLKWTLCVHFKCSRV